MASIPFITFIDNGYLISQQAQTFFKELDPNIKLSVVAIIGKYRTGMIYIKGKSYFVNKVLLNKNQTFRVGSTINACTKGLWLYQKTIEIEPNHHLLIIDSEGLGSTDVNKHQDSMIILMALLFSSYFIYNSVGTIDEIALTDLGTVLQLARKLDPKYVFPDFLWVVRDFSLQLVDKNGDQMNQKMYLEKILEFQKVFYSFKGISEVAQNKNQIRRIFLDMFPRRDCSLLIRPIENEELIQQLDYLDDSLLRPEFLNAIQKLRKKILKNAPIKTLNNRQLNGQMYLSSCQQYIETLNNGSMPTVQSTWTYVIKNQAQDEFNKISNQIDSIIKIKITQYQEKDLLKQTQNQLYEILCSKLKALMIDDQVYLEPFFIKLNQQLKQNLKQHNKNLFKIKQDEVRKNIDPIFMLIQSLSKSDGFDSIDELQEHINQLQLLSQGLFKEEILYLENQSIKCMLNKNKNLQNLVEQQKEIISQLQKEHIENIDSYEQNLNQIKSSLQQQINWQCQQKNILEQQLIQEKKHNEDLNQQNKFFQQQKISQDKNMLQILQNEIDLLQETNQKLIIENQQFQQNDQKTNDQSQHIQEKYEHYKNEYQIMNNEFQKYTSEAQKTIQDLLDDNKEKQKNIQKKQKQINQLNIMLKEQQSDFNLVLNEQKEKQLQINKQEAITQNEYFQQIKIIQEEKSDLELGIQKIRYQYNILQEQNMNLKKQKREQQNENNQISPNLEKLQQTFQTPAKTFIRKTKQLQINAKITQINKSILQNSKFNIEYRIEVQILNESYSNRPEFTWNVTRNYNQFCDLNSTLVKKFISLDKDNFKQILSGLYYNDCTVVMSAYQEQMNSYLQSLLQNKEICGCQELKDFLDYGRIQPQRPIKFKLLLQNQSGTNLSQSSHRSQLDSNFPANLPSNQIISPFQEKDNNFIKANNFVFKKQLSLHSKNNSVDYNKQENSYYKTNNSFNLQNSNNLTPKKFKRTNSSYLQFNK